MTWAGLPEDELVLREVVRAHGEAKAEGGGLQVPVLLPWGVLLQVLALNLGDSGRN